MSHSEIVLFRFAAATKDLKKLKLVKNIFKTRAKFVANQTKMSEYMK